MNPSRQLRSAAKDGRIDEVKELIESGRAKINQTNTYSWTPLMFACCNGHTGIVKVLLEHGAGDNINQMNYPGGNTALMLAIGKDANIDIVNALIEKEPSLINEKNYYNNWTPLMFACRNGHTDIVKVLLERGAGNGINEKTNNKKWTALMFACRYYGRTEIVRALLECGARESIDHKNKDGYTALMLASCRGNSAIVKVLISFSASIDEKNLNDRTALIEASCYGCAKIVNTLLEKGASITEKEKEFGNTALMLASHNGHIDVAKVLLQKGASISETNNDCSTALNIAQEENNHEIVKLLESPLTKSRQNIIHAPDFITGLSELVKHFENEFPADDDLINSIAKHIQNVFHAKLILMYINLTWRYGLISQEERNRYVKKILKETSKNTRTVKDTSVFKIILEMAEEEGIISRLESHIYDGNAVIKNVEHQLIKPLREEIQLLSNRLSVVEKKVDSLSNILKGLNQSFNQYKACQIQSVFFRGVLNIMSFGVGGAVVDVVQGPLFDSFFLDVVDFTDYDAIIDWIYRNETLNDVKDYLIEQFKDADALDVSKKILNGIARVYFDNQVGNSIQDEFANFEGDEKDSKLSIIAITTVARITQSLEEKVRIGTANQSESWLLKFLPIIRSLLVTRKVG